MKRQIISKLASLIVATSVFLLGALSMASGAYAGRFIPVGLNIPGLFRESPTATDVSLSNVAANPVDPLSQLKSEVVPELMEVLTPRQEELFETAIANGTSFRRTFKNLMLTPEQKRELKVVLGSVPKRDLFASLTPVQKKELFLKKKEAFIPTSEEIIDRINTGMPPGESISEEAQAKIESGIKKRDESMPSSETIMEKVKAGIENVKESLDD
ncbi:MAG: hypothetical protein DCF25_21585 [Leptolyngbya foveolarum]|uniref:Uncharacterized protein n=1 Tax=Leptolyngbya foveolarum TaxID=47253 RepID=A0A2W4VIV8_9CYAN|nr:MAG: hypothetical protein DCF25_21585 [Leptolyngbya foveolarum]